MIGKFYREIEEWARIRELAWRQANFPARPLLQ
jgi:hypothetical protein